VQEPQEDAALVCFLHLVQREQALGSLIALTMVPLHTPLQPQTSALSGIAGGLALALVADVADHDWPNIRWSRISCDVLAVLEQLEVPRAVGRVAVQHAADQLVVLDHQLLVHAALAGR
jgi:uncharacterized protein with ACT and thioredoxin-like domain